MTDHVTAGGPAALDRDYQSQVTFTATPEVVFAALTTTDGLTAWWTPVTGDGLAGGELTFTFGPASQAVMRVDTAECGVAVHWTNLDCMFEDWIGTTVHFDMEPTLAGGTELRFRHGGLTPRLECYLDCRSGWDHFIPSLRAYVETGTGNPNGSQADLARRAVRAERHRSAGAS